MATTTITAVTSTASVGSMAPRAAKKMNSRTAAPDTTQNAWASERRVGCDSSCRSGRWNAIETSKC
jgi:hypothetical protein